jgi:hypothetical protein
MAPKNVVSNSDIILKSARVKLPSWGAWDILKATWLELMFLRILFVFLSDNGSWTD